MTRRRRGFTLIELLVVISIIGVLVGLLLPAINAAREAGRRTQCQSQMRQIGLGLQGYANAKNSFPSAGTFMEDPTSVDFTNPASSAILSYVGPGSTAKGIPLYSWVVEILPYIDNQEAYNAFTRIPTASPFLGYLDPNPQSLGQPSNYKISTTAINILRCPDDVSATPGQGNLSYVVNGGFSLWHAIAVGWTGSAVDGGGAPNAFGGSGLLWGANWQQTMAVCQKLGVMHLESVMPPGTPGAMSKPPWNIKSTLTGIQDGASNTLLVGENTLAGASPGNPYSKSLETNWACPLPNFVSFIGSDNVCDSTNGLSGTDGNCAGGQLAPTATQDDGPGWDFANRNGTFENINFGQNLTLKGSFPFANSGHPGGSNFVFCDGSVRFLTSTINGTVYAKIITPSGSKLPLYAKQLPVDQDAFAQ